MKTKFKNANSPVKPGDLLITEEPFAFVLSSKEKGFRCDSCLAKGKVLKCSGCQFVYYCGRSCQKDAWNDHKWECANLKRISPKVIPDAARMLARVINRLNRGDGNSFRSFYTDKSFRMWKDLMSHYSDLKVDTKRMEHVSTLTAVLCDFMKDFSVPNTVELMGLYGRMVINSFTILDVDMNSVGTGIYLACSIVDHSCDPNAVATFDGKTISIRATKHMPHLDWNQVRISYIDQMTTPYERQSELLKNYYFLCQCNSCFDEKQWNYVHAAKCMNPNCDNPIQIPWKANCQVVKWPETDDVNKAVGNNKRVLNGNAKEKENASEEVIHCSECNTKYTEKGIKGFIKTMEFTELHLQDASTAYIDVSKYCLERQEGVFHPMNVMYAQTLDHAFDALIQVQMWDDACKYAERLLPCLRFYYGENHPLTALLYFKYGKILLLKMESKKALENLQCSEQILKITHGTSHPLYKQLLPLLSQALFEAT